MYFVTKVQSVRADMLIDSIEESSNSLDLYMSTAAAGQLHVRQVGIIFFLGKRGNTSGLEQTVYYTM